MALAGPPHRRRQDPCTRTDHRSRTRERRAEFAPRPPAGHRWAPSHGRPRLPAVTGGQSTPSTSRCRAGWRESGRADPYEQGGYLSGGDQGEPGRIIVCDPGLDRRRSPRRGPADPAHQSGDEPSTVIRPLSKNLRPVLYQRLAGNGVIRAAKAGRLASSPPHLAGPRCQPRGAGTAAGDPGAGTADSTGGAQRRAHRPAACVQVRAQDRRPPALPRVQATAQSMRRCDCRVQLGI